MGRHPGLITAPAAAFLAVGIAVPGCTATADDADWLLTPLSYDNRMDGDEGPSSVIDTPYAMSLVADTAGGFWGISAGSWLHVDGDGVAVSRFNVDEGAPQGAVAAVTSTRLLVATATPIPTSSGSIVLFDTTSKTWALLHADSRGLGSIATDGTDLYFVAYDYGASSFAVDRMSLVGKAEPVTVLAPVDGVGPVGIAVNGDGLIFIATVSERIVVDPEGAVLSRLEVQSERPGVAVNSRGGVAWSGESAAADELTAFIAGGSDEARLIMKQHDCSPEGLAAPCSSSDLLTVTRMDNEVTLPFLADPAGFTWINDRELVVSVGGEGGAPIVRVTPPTVADGDGGPVPR